MREEIIKKADEILEIGKSKLLDEPELTMKEEQVLLLYKDRKEVLVSTGTGWRGADYYVGVYDRKTQTTDYHSDIDFMTIFGLEERGYLEEGDFYVSPAPTTFYKLTPYGEDVLEGVMIREIDEVL